MTRFGAAVLQFGDAVGNLALFDASVPGAMAAWRTVLAHVTSPAIP